MLRRTSFLLPCALVAACSASTIGDTLMATLERYAGTWKTKLTASPEDAEMSQWFVDELRKHDGMEAQLQHYDIGPIFLPSQCSVSVQSEAFECYPIQPAPCRAHTKLDALPASAVAFVDVNNQTLSCELSNDGSLQAEEQQRLIVVNDDWTLVGEQFMAAGPYNTSAFDHEADRTLPRPYDWQFAPYNASLRPAVQLPPAAFHHAQQAPAITLDLQGRCVNGSSHNVIARWRAKGCSKSEGVLIVTTPTNGFGPAGGERGPGVAILLWLAGVLPQLVAEAKQPCTEVVLGLLSGHNEGSLGLKDFLGVLEGKGLGAANVSAFFSLGADIANHYTFRGSNYKGQGSGTMMLTPKATPQTWDALKAAVAGVPFVNATEISSSSDAGSGDNRYVYAAGYSMVGWQGWFLPRFHMATDYASSTDSIKLEGAAKFVVDALKNVLH